MKLEKIAYLLIGIAVIGTFVFFANSRQEVSVGAAGVGGHWIEDY